MKKLLAIIASVVFCVAALTACNDTTFVTSGEETASVAETDGFDIVPIQAIGEKFDMEVKGENMEFLSKV